MLIDLIIGRWVADLQDRETARCSEFVEIFQLVDCNGTFGTRTVLFLSTVYFKVKQFYIEYKTQN